MTLWEYLKSNMLRHPCQVVCENDAQMSFEDLVVWAEVFAKKLTGLRCCAIHCHSEMAAAMSLLACFAAQVTAVPLSQRYGAVHCQKILETISPDGIITDTDGYLHVLQITDAQYIPPKKHPALIMCTSGTTGKPKGVMLSEKNLITNVTDISVYFAIKKTDTILITRPLYHCAVLSGEFLTALIKGTQIRFLSEAFNPSKALSLIQQYHITAFCGTPTLLSMMSRFKRDTDTTTLQHICISGECMDAETGLRIHAAFSPCNIYHVYGLTEASPRVSYLPPELFTSYPDYVGIPLSSVSLKIINQNGFPCRANEPGLLWIKGNNTMIGYYRGPDRTAKTIKDGWLCTGDMAFFNEKGLLKILGRSDNLIIRAGMNIYPAEIETAIKKDPRVKEVLVYGFDNRFGKQIGMKIAGNFASVEEARELCKKTLPPLQLPTTIELLNELPKNQSGKISRT